MRKLFLLLSLVGMIFAACESGGGVEEESGGSTPTYKIELSKKTIEVGFEEGDYSVSVTSTCSWKASSDNDWIVIESKTGIAGTEELIFRVLTQTGEKERKGTIVIKNTDFNLIVELYIVQKPFEPKITIDSKSLNFAAQGGEQTVNITANFDYTVSTEANWISYSRVDNGLKIRATANTDTEKRTADIVISKENSDISEVININQDAEEAKSQIELSKQIIDVDFEEGSYSISVTSPYSWDAVSKNDWIIVETTTGIAGTEELQFRVLGQTEEKERKGTIVVKNTDYNLVAELYVIQKAFVPSIIVDPETISFTTEGGTQNIAVTANFEYEVSASADWVSFTKTDEGLTITIPNYIEVEERSAEITISNEKYNISKVVKVSQGAFIPELTVATETLSFSTDGGKQDVAITANIEYEVNISAEWLSCTKNENGITITVPNYAEIEKRTAEITISNEKYSISKIIKVTQCAFEPKLEVTPNEINFTADSGSQDIAITANFEYEVNTSAEWFSCTKNNNGITITVPNYAEVEERSAEITISSKKYNISKTIKVTQAGLSEEEYAKYCIVYTSSDGQVVTPYETNVFGANIVSNTYETGKGIIEFDAPITSIGDEAFQDCNNLRSVTIPNSVTSIGDDAFRYCSSLTSVTIGNSVTSIGSWAFYGCNSLTSVTLSDSVTSIGDNAFCSCSGLTSVTIGNSVTSIGYYAFDYCSSLTSVTIPDSVTSIGKCAFRSCSSLTAFYGKYASADNRCLVIDGVLSFFAPAGLTSYTIPDSVTSIGDDAFRDCSSLTSVTIGNSVTSIGDYAFQNCSSLASVTIPDSVTSIGYAAFRSCSSLTSVTIPNSVTSIGGDAFYNCSSLTSVYCKRRTPPTGGSSMFYNNASGRKIYVPRNSVDAYNFASYWIEYSSYIVGYDF